jgi:hypothetical protein
VRNPVEERGSVGSQKLQEHDPEVVKKRRFPVLQVSGIFYLKKDGEGKKEPL